MATVRFHEIGGTVVRCSGCERCSSTVSPEPVAAPVKVERRPFRDSVAYRATHPVSVPMPDVTTVLKVEADFDRAVAASARQWGRRWQRKGSGGNVIGPTDRGGFVGTPSHHLVPRHLRETARDMKTPMPFAMRETVREDAPARADDRFMIDLATGHVVPNPDHE